MEIPFFDFSKKDSNPALTSEPEANAHLQAYEAALEEVGESNPELGAALKGLYEAREKAQEDTGLWVKLRNMLNDQREKAQARTAGAEGHREQTRILIRSENPPDSQLHDLAGKMETANTLAAEHRAFAKELELDLEEAEINLIISRNKYGQAVKRANEIWSGIQFEIEYSAIKERLSRLIAFNQVVVFDDNANLNRNLRVDDLPISDEAINKLSKRLKKDLKPSLGNIQSKVYDFIFTGFIGSGEYQNKEPYSPTSLSVRRKALATRRQQSKGAQSQTN